MTQTMNVGTWLLPADEDTFDTAVRDQFPGAVWRCSQPGPPGLHPVHPHDSVGAAMACGGRGVQAFLHLPIGVSPPAAAVQLLRSTRRHDAGGTYCDHDSGCRQGAYFAAGRLAVRWYEDEVDADTHRVLLRQTRAVRSVLIDTTRPAHVEDRNGRRPAGYRIGPAAHAMAAATGILLGRSGAQRFRLV